MRKVVIESPYAGDTRRNVAYARMALKHSLHLGEAPYASHLLYTQQGVLDDNDPAQRAQGIAVGLAWGAGADATVVYNDYGTTPGMQMGIDRAPQEGRPVEYRYIMTKKQFERKTA